MRAAEPERPLHPALAVLMAVALHAGLIASVRGGAHSSPAAPVRSDVAAPVRSDIAVEFDLSFDASEPPPAAPLSEPALAMAASSIVPSRARAHPPARADRSAAAAPTPSEPESSGALEGPGNAPPLSSSSGSATARAIDLGLNDGVRRAALLGGWVEAPSAPARPSDGGLRQGLAALDAERGLARSSPATHAAYEATRRFAPSAGIGIFDVVANERGVVLSVTLASAPADEAKWQRVGQELLQLLKDRRLRVPPGAGGLAARLRIETGELALDIAERFRSKRGAALGQAPIHTREIRDESTRSSLEPGQLSPTLGVSIGGGASTSIRVVLLDERLLEAVSPH